MHNIYKYLSTIEIKSYQYFKNGKTIPIFYYPPFFIKGLLNIIESIIRNISGPFGLIIRRFYYSFIFKEMGKDVLIDMGVVFSGPQNIVCGNRVWFDTYSVINCPMSEVNIGNEVHIGSHCYMGGKKNITLKNYSALTCGSKIFSGSTNIPLKKNLILNPMIMKQAYENEGLNDSEVLLEENAVVLANCVIAPGVIMRKGSMLLPNSFLNKSTEEYSVHIGVPAKSIATRL